MKKQTGGSGPEPVGLPPAPPEHLSAESQELWRNIVPATVSAGRLALLTVALEARDRATAARRAVESEGMTVVNKATGAVHVHPLLKVEKDAQSLFVRAWGELRLDWQMGVDGRD